MLLTMRRDEAIAALRDDLPTIRRDFGGPHKTKMRACLLSILLGLTACSHAESLTHARPRLSGCQAQADGAAIVCGGYVAATLRCTRRGYEACNVLVVTYSDGEAVTLHELRNDPKCDVVSRIAVERNGDRIWFTESDLSLWATLLGRNGGFSSHARVFHVWTGVARDDKDAAGSDAPSRVSRGEAVLLASEEKPTPGRP